MATTSLTDVYTAQVEITGTTGLVLDNIDSMDPDGKIAREIKKITDKSEMTEEDRYRKDRLSYSGSLYLDSERNLVLPWRCIKRALISGAYQIGSTSLAGKMDKGVESSATEFALNYTGPEPDKMFDDEQFRLRLMVNKNPTGKKAMVPSVRPILPKWDLTCKVNVFNGIIGWDKFTESIKATGLLIGVGNARKLGYGRFAANVTKLEIKKP